MFFTIVALTSRYQFRAWNRSDRDRCRVKKENNKISRSRIVLEAKSLRKKLKFHQKQPSSAHTK